MVAQTRILEADTGAKLAGQRQSVSYIAERAQNVHGFRAEINIESEVMDANSNGHWAVYRLPGNVIDSGDFLATWSSFNDEDISQYIWGVGLWMASNQTPAHIVFAPGTTRNLQKGGRIVVDCWVEGTVPILTANRINVLMTGFVSQ